MRVGLATIAGIDSWGAALLVLLILALAGALRLFTEWQRRKTFVLLLKNAPNGTVIVQKDGPEGQAMTVAWGGREMEELGPPGRPS